MKRRHCIALAILLAAMAVSAWLFLHPRQLPLAECSELYQRYADSPHVSVAFIRDFPVNDTLSLDVTTLTALDSTGWEILKKDFRVLPIPEFTQQQINRGFDIVTMHYAPKSNPTLPMDTTDFLKNNQIAISRLNHTVSIFYTETRAEQNAVFDNRINKGLILWC